MVKIAPSILSADFSKLGEEVKAVDEAGADWIHIDIMDGHFVPNISIGPDVVKSIRPCTDLLFDVHLMIEHPHNYVQEFASAGSDLINIHLESKSPVKETLESIESLGKKRGITLCPGTPLSKATSYFDDVELILIMTVEPGFAGQSFMREVLPKIEEARRVIEESEYKVDLEVDGGVKIDTAPLAVKAGANVLVSGSGIYGGDVRKNIAEMRKAVEGIRQ